MKLTALRMHNVRRFAGRGVRIENIGSGVNVLCAANEFGKSTSFDALHALFFQPHTGTPGAVQALRPYSGGNPLVEADLVTGDGAFRLTKQFYGSRRAEVRERDTGRIIAQADEAERFIAGLVKGGTSGPAGLLWVRQGITGIERRAKPDEEAEKRARASVLTSVQGEVEALTGGRRMAQALAACEEELARLVTSKRQTPTGVYAAAIAEHDRLVEQERRLAAEVTDLRAALDSRRSVRAQLAEIGTPEKTQERQAALAQAEAELAVARTQSEALRTAQSDAALAGNRRDAASQALTSFRQALARHAELREVAAAAERRREAAHARRRDAAVASKEASATVSTSERDEREQRELLTRLERALSARAAAERLVSARAAHAQAEAARAEVESTEALLKSLSLPAGKLAELERVEDQLLRLHAAASARAAQIRVDYTVGRAAGIKLDGAALGDGEERTLVDTALVEIDGVGRLTITVPQAAEGQQERAKAQAAQQALLGELRVESLAAARLRETQVRELSAKLDLARQRLALLAPKGMTALREEIARLEAEAGSAAEPLGDSATQRSSLQAAENRVLSSREAAREQQARSDAAGVAVVEAERELAGLASSLSALAESLGPEDERRSREERLVTAYEGAERELGTVQLRFEHLSAQTTDLAAAEARQRRMRSVAEAARDQIARLREEAAALNGRIQTRAEGAVEETWQEARDKLGDAERQVAGLGREAALLTRLRDALEAARSEARDHYFAPVLRELRPLLGLLFEDATVTFDEDTLLPRSVLRNGLEEPVGVLSGGMREQLAVLTRLAFARLLAKDGQPAPVILDDALVYSDDDRIEKMFDALHRQAADQQIIVFSCRQRAFSQLGGHLLRIEPWQPEG
ncbi:DNA-binding protein [Bosea vestrisii]|uniref:AAA family ATPase n=1 Tax=Bosea vestrisii TaxID=151416 RepID=UPI0024DFC6B5|nr:DNA-binding protein [Bosea vestrisii]WID95082.1 DNA-binding protein [Bosea vestrisii]